MPYSLSVSTLAAVLPHPTPLAAKVIGTTAVFPAVWAKSPWAPTPTFWMFTEHGFVALQK